MPYLQGQEIQGQNSISNLENKNLSSGNLNNKQIKKLEESNKKHILSDSDSLSSSEDSGK